MQSIALRGSFVALITPMNADGSIEPSALDDLVEAHLDAGTAGLVVGGTTGESATLLRDELHDLVRHVVERVDGRCPVIAGAGSPSTRTAVDLARGVTAAGADALLCVTPYYLRTTQAGLIAHFRAIGDAVDRPLVLYNVPSRTGVDLLPETVAAAAELADVVGVKEAVAGAERVRRHGECSGDRVVVLSGDDASCRVAMEAGARAVISVTANLAPLPMAELCRAVLAGDRGAARAVDAQLQPLHALLMAEPNPIPVKWALARLGRIPAGLRLPLVPPSDDLAGRLDALLDSLADRLLEPVAEELEKG